MKNLGNAIRKCRERRDLNRSQLATASDVTVGTISLIESGQRSPSMQSLTRIADALDLPVWILMYMAEDEQ